MVEIAPKLWLGNALEIRDPKLLFDLGIRAIVDLAYEEQPFVPARQFLYHRFPLTDAGGNDSSTIQLALQTLSELIQVGAPTAIACSAGMSRSPTIAAFALSICSEVKPQEVVEQIAELRALEINPAFWNDVKSAESKLR